MEKIKMIWIISIIVAIIVLSSLIGPSKPTAYNKLQSGQPLDENDWAELRLWDSHFWNDFH